MKLFIIAMVACIVAFLLWDTEAKTHRHRWFAWRPVKADGQVVWWTWLEREWIRFGEFGWWEYTRLDSTGDADW